MTTAHAREVDRLRRQIAALERENEHLHEVNATLADQLATARGEVTEAIELGQHFATALRWAVPHSPALLRTKELNQER